MAFGVFPTTSVLTSFLGPDEAPLSEGGRWLGPMQSGQQQLQRVSNRAAWTTSLSQSYWAPNSFTDSEVYASLPTLPASGDGIAVWARLANPGNPTTGAAYLFVYTVDTGFRYFKMTAGGSFAQLGVTLTPHVVAAGESIGFRVSGSAPATLQGYYSTAGVFIATTATTDASAVITGPGRIGLEISSASARVGEFGGGEALQDLMLLLPPAGRGASW